MLRPRDFLIAMAGFVALVSSRAPLWTVVEGIVAATVGLLVI